MNLCTNTDKWLINLSNKIIPSDFKEMLYLGGKFGISIKQRNFQYKKSYQMKLVYNFLIPSKILLEMKLFFKLNFFLNLAFYLTILIFSITTFLKQKEFLNKVVTQLLLKLIKVV